MVVILTRLAGRAEVPVFLARGLGSGPADARLRRARAVRLVDSPRAATVLVIAGRVPDAMSAPLAQVHDQLSHPRATVWWTGGDGDGITAHWPHATVVGPGDDVEAAIVASHRALLTGARSSEPPRLADVEPAEWRGVGPYGQGGSGMTGGVPFGRPLAGRDDDRDGLTLDVVPVQVGPYFWAFPPGLVLRVTFAGDVVHAVEVRDSPSPTGHGIGAPLPDDALDPFRDLAEGPVGVAALEHARARHHLRELGRLLHLYGLDALARRVLDAAHRAATLTTGDLSALRRRVERPWRLGWVTAGVGVVTGDDAAECGGSVARAAGIALDERLASPTYRALGFEPVTFAAGDVRDRWRQRLAEAALALDLAARARDRLLEPGEPVEWPVPQGAGVPADVMVRALTGAEWGDAVATVASLGGGAPLEVPVAR